MANKKNFLVSTDLIGVFGSIHDWIDTWGFVLDHPHFKGVEMIGWRGAARRLEKYRSVGIPVVGIHGRTGGIAETRDVGDLVTLPAINQLFDTVTSLAHTATQVEYLLFHIGLVPHILSCNALQSAPLLVIENDTKRNSVDACVNALTTLRDHGITAEVTYDIVHYLREGDGHVKMSRWDDALKVFETVKPTGFHLPIGTHTSDSLPLTSMPLSALKELGSAISGHRPKYVILENQQIRRYSLKLPKSVIASVRARNSHLIDILGDSGIL